MIMNHKKIQYADQSYEQFEAEVKMKALQVMHQLMQYNICNTFVQCVFIFIENLQFVYYSIHPIIRFLWKTDFLEYFRISIRFFQFNYILELGNPDTFIIILYTSFGIMLLCTLLWYYFFYRLGDYKVNTQISTIFQLQIKIYSLFAMTIKQTYIPYTSHISNVLLLPFFNVFIAAIYCKTDMPSTENLGCYQGLHILHMIVAIFGVLLAIIFATVFTIFFTDLNPNSPVPFNGLLSDAIYLRMSLKFFLPFLVIFNSAGIYNREYVSLLSVVYLFIIWVRYVQPPQYNRMIYWFSLSMEVFVLWVATNTVIVAFLDFDQVDNLGLLYMFITLPIMIPGSLQIFRQKESYIQTLIMKNIKNEKEADYYLIILQKLIQERQIQGQRIILFGMLKNHYSNCIKKESGCCCSDLINLDHKQEETENETKLWYTFYKCILEECLEKFSKQARFHILYAYIAHDRLENRYKALYELMIAEDSKPDMREEMSIFIFKYHIESEMNEFDSSEQYRQLDVNMIVEFQNKFVVLTQSIKKSVEYHLEFWRELQEDNPNLQKLQKIGQKVTDSVFLCQDEFNELLGINSQNLKTLEMFGQYLLDVVNDEEEGNRIMDKCLYIQKNQGQKAMLVQEKMDNEKQKFSEETTIISVSGNYNSIGQVVSCNNEIIDLLEFYQSDLVGQNINRIMPKLIGDVHDDLMKLFLETSKSKLIGNERLVFPQNKFGYLCPCKLMIKVLPNLDQGIQIVGFLRKIYLEEGSHFILYDLDSLQILGITESFNRSFGVSSEMIFNPATEFLLHYIFKDFADQEDQLKEFRLAEEKGIITTLDTTQLGQIYQYQDKKDMTDSQIINASGMLESSGKKEFMRQSKVRISLYEEKQFGSLIIHTMKVNELLEDEGEYNQDNKNSQKQQEIEDNIKEINQEDNDKDIEEEQEESQQKEKQLKDLRQVINQKKTPKKILHLKYLAFFLIICLIGLSITKLVLNLQSQSFMYDGIRAISQAYKRHSLMADVNKYCRYLELLSSNFMKTDQIDLLEAQYKANVSLKLTVLVDQLQKIQFEVIKARITLEANSDENTSEDSYSIKFLLQSNGTKEYDNVFNDALFQFITSASSIKKSSLDSFQNSDQVESTQKNIYFVVENGLYVLRDASEQIAEKFFNFYYDYTKKNIIIQISIIVSAVLIIFIIQIIFIPIVFQVHKHNKITMSYFGKISLEDIKNLITKADNYLKNFIEKFSDKKENGEYDDDERYNEQVQKPQDSSKNDYQQIVEQQDKEEDPQSQLSPKSPKEQTHHFAKILQENQKQKSEKLIESKGVNHNLIVCQFLIAAIVLMTEYVTMYIIENDFTENLQNAMQHFQLASKRPSILKYDVLFTMEQIVNDGKPLIYENQDISVLYNDRLYTNEEKLFKSLIKSYPEQFQNYFEKFKEVNYYDICTSIGWINNPESIKDGFIFVEVQSEYEDLQNQGRILEMSSKQLTEECLKINNGLLQKGLRNGVITIALNSAQIKNNYQQFKSLDSLDRLIKYVIPSMIELNDNIYDSINQYIANQDNAQIYNFIGFMIFLLIILATCWIPYLNSLQNKIWRIKGMLTMIPLKIIQKTDGLRQQVEKDILGNVIEQY